MELTSSNNSNGNRNSIGSATVTPTTNPASDSKNRKPQTAQQLNRENIQHLIERLEAGHSETLTNYLRAMVRFRQYSFGNIIAIARQKPDATHVAGIRTWNELGRFVNKGERGIAILAPVIGKSQKKRDSDGKDAEEGQSALLGFRRVYVWDISGTHGMPLPELEQVTGEPGIYLDRLRKFVSEQGITLEYTESIAPALGTASGTTIRLLPGQSKAEEFNTLVHELAHLALKHGERRTAITKTVRETEAEAVAFVVAEGVGLEADQSASYIQLYHGDAKLLQESLEVVQRTASQILEAIRPKEEEVTTLAAAGLKDTTAQTAAETTPEVEP
jgi:hypothetical protein